MSASVVNAVENLAFINFKIFPNPAVIPPDPLAGGTIDINFRCCLLTHTVFNFLFALFIMLICAIVVEPVCSVKHALKTLEMIATSGFLTALECTKFVFGRGSAPDPAGGAHDVPPDPLVGWGGGYPLPILQTLDAYGDSTSRQLP